MKRLFETKLTIFLLACVGLVALALLSIILRDYTFREPEPFSFNIMGGLTGLTQSGISDEIPFWKFLLFGILLLVIAATIWMLLDPETRKFILLKLLRFTMTILAVWLLMNYAYERGSLKTLFNLIPAITEANPAATNQTSAFEYVPPQISPWLVLAVSFGIGLLLVWLGWFMITHWPKPPVSQTKEQIAGIAREALSGLQPGADWDQAIVRAYIRMNEVVTVERGLVRQPATTPSEFAGRMERAGLPAQAVKSLTQLFEGVRYGGKSASAAERDLAAAALSAILRACGVNL